MISDGIKLMWLHDSRPLQRRRHNLTTEQKHRLLETFPDPPNEKLILRAIEKVRSDTKKEAASPVA